jgi:hypothetical protein
MNQPQGDNMNFKILAATSLLSMSLLGSISFAQSEESFDEATSMTEMSVDAPEMTDIEYRDHGRGGRDRRPGREFYQCSAHGVRNDRRLFYGEVFRDRNRAARSALNACRQYRNNCVLYQCLRVR